MATCKLFSKCKIFSGENIFGKGKYFLVFSCILKIVLENREVDRERDRNQVKGGGGVDLEVVTMIFGGDDEIGHGWVDLEGSGDKIERGGRDEL